MPAKPTWYADLDQILRALENDPRDEVDRATVEALLGVGPRRAQQLLAPCLTRRIGTSSLADRGKLIAHLRAVAASDAAVYEQRRRVKLATTLDTLRRDWLAQPQVLVSAPDVIVNQEVAGLPEGVTLAPGQITVRCSTPAEAAERLLALAFAIGNDPDGVARRLGSPQETENKSR